MPFTEEEHLKQLVDLAIVAIECENSLWRSKSMPDYHTAMSPQKRLGGKLGLKKTAVLPTIIIKQEDLGPLNKWQMENSKPIHVWHVFFDQAFGIAFDRALSLFSDGFIEPTRQIFQAPGGATTEKVIYKTYYRYGYPLGTTVEMPNLAAAHVEDKNGHILPYVKFEGGKLKLTHEAADVLAKLMP